MILSRPCHGSGAPPRKTSRGRLFAAGAIGAPSSRLIPLVTLHHRQSSRVRRKPARKLGGDAGEPARLPKEDSPVEGVVRGASSRSVTVLRPVVGIDLDDRRRGAHHPDGLRQKERVAQVDDVRRPAANGTGQPQGCPHPAREGVAVEKEPALKRGRSVGRRGVGAEAEDLDLGTEQTPGLRLGSDLPDDSILDEGIPVTDVGDLHRFGVLCQALDRRSHRLLESVRDERPACGSDPCGASFGWAL